MGKWSHGTSFPLVRCEPTTDLLLEHTNCSFAPTLIIHSRWLYKIVSLTTPQLLTMSTTNTSSSPTTTSSSASDSRRASHFCTSGERRTSETWDASKVPPSQFQRPAGSIYSTPNSKDGNVERGDRDKAYFEKLKEKVC
jgi:hypothetical protein